MIVTFNRELQELPLTPPDTERRYPPLEPGVLVLPDERGEAPNFREFDDLLFRSPNEEVYSLFQQQVKEFYDSRVVSLHLRDETGVPYLLYGDLADAAEEGYGAVAERFLTQYELMLTGVEEETFLQLARVSVWQEQTHHLTFAQHSVQKVPVYGANIVLVFQDKTLTGISNSLFPLRREDSQFFEDETFHWPAPAWLQTLRIYNLPDEIKIARLLSPPNVNLDLPSIDLGGVATDAWVLPYVATDTSLAPEKAPQLVDGWWILPNPLTDKLELRPNPWAGYRPVWRIVIEDEAQNHWLALVDAETDDLLVLHATAMHFPTMDCLVYPENPTATPATLQILTLWDGSNLADVTQPIWFDQAASLGFFDPPDAQNNPAVLIPQRPGQLLTANVYFHLSTTRDWFEELLSRFDLRYYLPAVYPLDQVNPLRKLNVKLSGIDDAKYEPGTNTIEVGDGTNNSIRDPGLDRDVLYHEFVHAIVHLLAPQCFHYTAVASQQFTQKRYTGSVNEGIAWFFACALSENTTWADHSYPVGHWQDAFELGQVPSSAAASVVIHPSLDFAHNHGLWWARVFQQVSGQTVMWQTLETLIRTVDFLSAPVTSLPMFGRHWYAYTRLTPVRANYRPDLYQQIRDTLATLDVPL